MSAMLGITHVNKERDDRFSTYPSLKESILRIRQLSFLQGFLIVIAMTFHFGSNNANKRF